MVRQLIPTVLLFPPAAPAAAPGGVAPKMATTAADVTTLSVVTTSTSVTTAAGTAPTTTTSTVTVSCTPAVTSASHIYRRLAGTNEDPPVPIYLHSTVYEILTLPDSQYPSTKISPNYVRIWNLSATGCHQAWDIQIPRLQLSPPKCELHLRRPATVLQASLGWDSIAAKLVLLLPGHPDPFRVGEEVLLPPGSPIPAKCPQSPTWDALVRLLRRPPSSKRSQSPTADDPSTAKSARTYNSDGSLPDRDSSMEVDITAEDMLRGPLQFGLAVVKPSAPSTAPRRNPSSRRSSTSDACTDSSLPSTSTAPAPQRKRPRFKKPAPPSSAASATARTTVAASPATAPSTSLAPPALVSASSSPSTKKSAAPTATSVTRPTAETPPPIILKSTISNFQRFQASVGPLLRKGSYLKATPGGYTIYCHTLPEHAAVMDFLTKENIPSFTYASPSQADFKLILRGLPRGIDTTSIEDDLTAQGFPPLHVRRLQVDRRPTNVCELRFPDTADMRAVDQLKVVCLHVVTWETPRPSGPSICTRCGAPRHTSTYCRMPTRCMHCGSTGHQAFDCPTGLDDPCCFRCQGPHRATWKGCPKLQRLMAPSVDATPTPVSAPAATPAPAPPLSPAKPVTPALTFSAAVAATSSSPPPSTAASTSPPPPPLALAPPPDSLAALLARLDQLFALVNTVMSLLTQLLPRLVPTNGV